MFYKVNSCFIKIILIIIFSVGCEKENVQIKFLEKKTQSFQERIIKGSLDVIDSLHIYDNFGIISEGGLNVNEQFLFIVDRSDLNIYFIDKNTYEIILYIDIPEGNGPGELTMIGSYDVTDDYVVVSNENQQKIQYWNTEGELISEFITEYISPHRIVLNRNNNVVVLSPVLTEVENLFYLFSLKGHVIRSFEEIQSENYNPLMYPGSINIDQDNNIFYAGFAEHIIKKWDEEGNLKFSKSTVDNMPSQVNYASFTGSEQQVFRYSEHGYFSALGSAIYDDYWLILHAGVSNEDYHFPLLDIYNKVNGEYHFSLELPYRAGRGQISIDEYFIYIIHEINNESYLFLYENNLLDVLY